MDLRHETILGNLKLIPRVINDRLPGMRMHDEDLIQDGVVGLIGAIDRFDSSRGCKLSTSAYWSILGSVQRGSERLSLVRVPSVTRFDVLKGRSKVKVDFCIVRSVPEKGERDPENPVIARDLMSNLMSKLSPYDRLLVRLSFFEGMSAREIGSTINRNKSSISKSIRDAICQMRRFGEPDLTQTG